MAELYQLRVVLRDVSPLVWRRLLISSETSLTQLDELLLLAFAWSGAHLHLFHIHGRDYGVSQYGGITFSEMPVKSGFPVSGCMMASGSGMNTSSRLLGCWICGWSGHFLGMRSAPCRYAPAEVEPRRRKTVVGPWTIWRGWTRTGGVCRSRIARS